MSQSSLESTSSTLTLIPNSPEILHLSYAASSTALLTLSPSAVPVGLARLPGFALALSPSGRVNAVPVQGGAAAARGSTDNGPGPAANPTDAQDEARDGAGVYGLLYLVPEEHEPRLDAALAPYGKTIQEVELFPPPGAAAGDGPAGAQFVRALVYLDSQPGSPGTPDLGHAAAVKDAVGEAVGWGMPAWYVERVGRLIPLGERAGGSEGEGTGRVGGAVC